MNTLSERDDTTQTEITAGELLEVAELEAVIGGAISVEAAGGTSGGGRDRASISSEARGR